LKKGDDYQKLYDKEKGKIDKILSKALEHREPVALYEPAYYIIKNGGKRLRPLLVLFSCRSVGGKFRNAYNAAAAVELLHNFTLVHDDIMDNANKRRGMLTMHVKYDMNTAVLSGDSLLSVAYEYLLKDCKNRGTEVISEFTNSLIEVCEGQALDKIYELEKNVSIADYLEMINKKTAAMLTTSCKIGGILGNGSSREIKALAAFGRNIGIAFQIQDDLLDIRGYEEFGKTTGGDLMEGKKTYLFLRALEKAKGSDKRDLYKIIERKGVPEHEVNYYIELYKRNGITEDAESEIKKYTSRAVKALDILKEENYKKLFYWLADSLIKRNK
jgi:geranylgeranyl diphosphate synthase, type II